MASMQRLVAKLLALVGVFIIPICCTALAWKVSAVFSRKGAGGKVILGWLMCFGGGVFFATYILHMGPEVRDILYKSLLKPNHIEYPVAELIMSFGFFLVLFIEHFALSMHTRMNAPKQYPVDFLAKQDEIVKMVPPPGAEESDNTHLDPQQTPKFPEEKTKTQEPIWLLANDKSTFNYNKNGSIGGQVVLTKEEEYNEMGHGHSHDVIDPHASRSLVLVIALSLHRIFEGMSVGLTRSVTGMWSLFAAVMCHEAVIGFSLGLQFVKNDFRLRRFLLYTFLCSCIMPVGVAIGIIIVENGNESNTLNIVNGVLQAMSTGTFIYVTFFEILHEELSHENTTTGKLISVVAGFAVMAALSAIPEETRYGPGSPGWTQSVDLNFTQVVTSRPSFIP